LHSSVIFREALQSVGKNDLFGKRILNRATLGDNLFPGKNQGVRFWLLTNSGAVMGFVEYSRGQVLTFNKIGRGDEIYEE